jgi:membrane protein DedA with SNARE-associated domain
LSGITHTFASLLSEYGVPALFLTIALESLGAPLPGESAIILASGAAAEGRLSIHAVVLAAFVGAVLGDNVGYLIGRRLGRPVIVRYGSRFGITDARFDKVEAVARQRGALMVVVARFVVVLRQLNGIVAGSSGMPWPRFLAANIAGAALWVGLWSTLAYRFGRSLDVLPFLLHHLSLVAAIATPLLIAALAYLKLRPGHRSTP